MLDASTVAGTRETRGVRVLFVGKRPDLYAVLWRKLGLRGVDMAFATSQAQAMREAIQSPPDAIIVDGVSMVSRRRAFGALRRVAPLATLILIDDGTSAPEDRAIDVLLQPPVAWQTLAGLLEQPRKVEDVIVSGPFRLCISSRTLTGLCGEKRLSPMLCDLMACFVRHPGEVLTRPVLMREVWRTSYVGDTRTLDVHVRWLRRIVEPEPSRPVIIVTRQGAGYVFMPGECSMVDLLESGVRRSYVDEAVQRTDR